MKKCRAGERRPPSRAALLSAVTLASVLWTSEAHGHLRLKGEAGTEVRALRDGHVAEALQYRSGLV
jgi:hypothetical protein